VDATPETLCSIDPEHRVLLLRTNDANMRSFGGFTWPESGWCVAPDWEPKPKCGHGLHGLLWGAGNSVLLDWDKTAKWLVVEADARELVDLDGKVKVPRGRVVHVGDQVSATQYLYNNDGHCSSIVGLSLTVGHGVRVVGGAQSVLTGGHDVVLTGGFGSLLVGGHRSVLTAGSDSVLSGGEASRLTGGEFCQLTGGYGAELSAGSNARLLGGDVSVLTAGNYSVLTGGVCSVLTAGRDSKLVGGHSSKLTAGRDSVLIGDRQSTFAGGEGSVFSCRWLDDSRLRLVTAYVGEDGIEPDRPYHFAGGAFHLVDRS
jgi:hypothetical protein